ncbi:multidrug resistance-associated protein 5 [Platysternon megacephalum]|uniref:Multidrug resistance-associated protein 5 n=1 Tax=Platysternon megacephalum TaxID=55544 RepID=A0A4D9DSA7_9SAUR|nr:multidrug resistance-associated protein 5 [Platysternon megacephalum]
MEPACDVSRRGCLAPFAGPRALAAPESAGSPSPEPPNGCTGPLPAKAAYGQDPASCYIPLRRLQDLASMISAEYLNGAADGPGALPEPSDSRPGSPRPAEPAALGSPQQPAGGGREAQGAPSAARDSQALQGEGAAAGSPEAQAELSRRSLARATCCEEPGAELGRAGPGGGSADRRHNEPISALLCSPSPPAEVQGKASRDAGVGRRTERVELRPVPGPVGPTRGKAEQPFSTTDGSDKEDPAPSPSALRSAIEIPEPSAGIPFVSSLWYRLAALWESRALLVTGGMGWGGGANRMSGACKHAGPSVYFSSHNQVGG